MECPLQLASFLTTVVVLRKTHPSFYGVLILTPSSDLVSGPGFPEKQRLREAGLPQGTRVSEHRVQGKTGSEAKV